ncbi:unnamed protein product [Protopolystoma xenopodis]|uniref:Uncharacterized protein n=1 Tax=Protopolystoma xenopodis TaxID=117903 RepID=A0A3S5FDB4_9PLAT|nr:unnamed protein product [Protopolystoma xenopodis]
MVVNGIDLQRATHAHALEVFRGATEPILVEVARRDPCTGISGAYHLPTGQPPFNISSSRTGEALSRHLVRRASGATVAVGANFRAIRPRPTGQPVKVVSDGCRTIDHAEEVLGLASAGKKVAKQEDEEDEMRQDGQGISRNAGVQTEATCQVRHAQGIQCFGSSPSCFCCCSCTSCCLCCHDEPSVSRVPDAAVALAAAAELASREITNALGLVSESEQLAHSV